LGIKGQTNDLQKEKLPVNHSAERFVVVTGGPGSGKSALIAALHQRGYARSIEAGRAVIQDQMAIGGHALPWDDRAMFAEVMLSWEMRSYHIAQHSSDLAFFDRGVPDVLGYLRLVNLPVPEHMRKAAEIFRYHRQVFIAPPWQEIFHQDNERKQDFDEAIRTYQSMVITYRECCYDLVELPCVSVQERMHFVLHRVGIEAGPL
jgi:predicted ATPase